MKRTYKKKSNLINKTGYTPGYDTENNPVNYIPSENITMANTPYPIYATPLDENGNPINNSIVMKPGGEYKFPGASYVAETPIFKDGGKSDWISAKISTLVKEGYPQKQAVAIAYSMYEDAKKEQGGYQLPMYQTAGTYNFGSGLPKPKFSADPNIATPEQFSEQMNKITEVNPGKYGLGKDPNYVSPLSEESLTAGEDFKKRTDEIGKAAGLPQNFSANIFGETNTESTTKKTELAPPDIKDGQPYQFFNPYSGFDIPTAASTLGSSIESGDTLGTVASGLKLATGLARNFFGGMGQERRKNYVQKEFYDKQREGMTGAGREEMLESGGYYQEGGMEQTGSDVQSQVVQALQQGASPEEIMQQLIQMGMPEEQAIGLIQSIMQQMQPSTPQLRRGGMMYYQDGGEDKEEPTDWYEEGMDKDTYYGFKNQLEAQGYKSVQKPEEEEEDKDELKEDEKEVSYDKNSARDTWVAKTGMPWSEAKRLGYTDGSAKDNIKLLSELNDPRFKKEYLRSKPLSPAKKQKVYSENSFGESPKTFQQQLMDDFSKKSNNKKEVKPRNIDVVSQFYQNNQNPFIIGQQWSLPVGAKSVKEPVTKSNGERYMENITGWLNNNAPTMFQPRAYYQDGGEQQIAQQVAQAMQQGMQPQEAMSMLVESGMSEDQAIQLIQAIMGQIQQQGETSQNEEMSQGTPQLRKGGEMIRRADGSYSKRGLWDNIRDNAGSGKKPTKEMLEQEAKIKREYQEGGMEPNMEQQAQGDPTEAIMQQIAQMLEQGADPQQVMQMLVEAGVPEEQAIQMVEAVMQQSQDMPEMRDGGIPERYKNMGFTKVGAKKQSTRPGKKWMVLAKKGDQYKVVHGGDDSMKDFSQHGSESRKENFWNRMGGRDSAKANDPFSPLYWHKKFGTWQDGGEMMDEEMEGENEYMENESVMLEQVEDQVEQALKQGADPQQILEQLIQMGIPQETAQQMIEEILQEIAEGETEMEEGTPQMSKGGKYMRALQGKTIKDYKYNPETNSYTVSYE